jgi:NADPH-dependent ferric siderophore reductase
VHGGLEFRPPEGHVGPTLLVGDETAVPAVLSILGGLPAAAHGEALLEVPDAGDITDVAVPVGVRITWLVRPADGSALPDAVRDAVRRFGLAAGQAPGESAPADEEGDEPLWDVPAQARAAGAYAWLAGESTVITGLRRYLVRDLGVDREGVAFMGYWKRGRAEC